MALSATDEDGTVSIRYGEDLLARYRAETAASKPHFDVLALPSDAGDPLARNLVLAAPHDHAWHLGLFFCQKLVDGLNCWESELHEAAGKPHGVAESRGYDVTEGGGEVGLTQTVEWVSDGGERLLGDERTIRIDTPDEEGYLLTWEQSVTALEATRHLSSETEHGHYSGLSLRFVRDLTNGRVTYPDEDDPLDADAANGHAAPWCDYSGHLDGNYGTGKPWRAGVTLLNHPENDPHPIEWFTMGAEFGFIAANPTWKTVLTLAAGETVSWRWGVWIHAGTPDSERIAGIYDEFR